ncbi:sorting nexin [Anaeramoeba flamelloides]|uniref:Sorting nexin n=1 Tax=Anaeramoeba flamelloides TaxID=1746091 RepID=A0ABQ8XT44_9EUKA|nr:sorting nexin [Anaeramoeba flamelloides]
MSNETGSGKLVQPFYVQVIKPWTSHGENEMSIKVGEILVVVEDHPGWYLGYSDPQEENFFPKHCVTQYEDTESEEDENISIKNEYNSENLINNTNTNTTNNENMGIKINNLNNINKIKDEKREKNVKKQVDNNIETKKNTKTKNKKKKNNNPIFIGDVKLTIKENLTWSANDNSKPIEITVQKEQKETSKYHIQKKITLFNIQLKGQTIVQYSLKDFYKLQLGLKRIFFSIPIPSLPKFRSGVFTNKLNIENQKRILENFVNKIIKHPVLGRSYLMHSFLNLIQNIDNIDNNNDQYENFNNFNRNNISGNKFSNNISEGKHKFQFENSIQSKLLPLSKSKRTTISQFQKHIPKMKRSFLDIKLRIREFKEGKSNLVLDESDVIKSLSSLSKIGIEWRKHEILDKNSTQNIINMKKIFLEITNTLTKEVMLNEMENYSTNFFLLMEELINWIESFEKIFQIRSNFVNTLQENKKNFKKKLNSELQSSNNNSNNNNDNNNNNNRIKKLKLQLKNEIDFLDRIDICILAELEYFKYHFNVSLKNIIHEFLNSKIQSHQNAILFFSNTLKNIQNVDFRHGTSLKFKNDDDNFLSPQIISKKGRQIEKERKKENVIKERTEIVIKERKEEKERTERKEKEGNDKEETERREKESKQKERKDKGRKIKK